MLPWYRMPVMNKLPIPLHNAIDIAALCRMDPCDESAVLGSFWLKSRKSFESKLVKAFKSCSPVGAYRPHISLLCQFYSELIIARAGTEFDWVVRVLGSQEMRAEPDRPQSALIDMVCARTSAVSPSEMFYRIGVRPPMRSVARLAGPDALKARLQYAAQDLFIRPKQIGGRALLIDDIANTGASMRIYAFALKEFAGVDRVFAINLAATRFLAGKDGRGLLKLDTGSLAAESLAEVWVDDRAFHIDQNCPAITGKAASEVRFVAERNHHPCPTCAVQKSSKRRWWQFGRTA